MPPLDVLFRPGMRFRGDIRIPGIRDDASSDVREVYQLDIIAHESLFAGAGHGDQLDSQRTVLCWHQAYEDAQICPIVLAGTDNTAALKFRWADAETECTGTIQDTASMAITGTVAQLVHGEDGFLHASDAVTHTFSLCREMLSPAAVEASVSLFLIRMPTLLARSLFCGDFGLE